MSPRRRAILRLLRDEGRLSGMTMAARMGRSAWRSMGYLEKRGLVTSEDNGDGVKLFTITDAGREIADRECGPAREASR